MTTAHVVETSVTVNNNSPIQVYVHPDDQTQLFEMTPGLKPFTVLLFLFKELGPELLVKTASSHLKFTLTFICVIPNE